MSIRHRQQEVGMSYRNLKAGLASQAVEGRQSAGDQGKRLPDMFRLHQLDKINGRAGSAILRMDSFPSGSPLSLVGICEQPESTFVGCTGITVNLFRAYFFENEEGEQKW